MDSAIVHACFQLNNDKSYENNFIDIKYINNVLKIIFSFLAIKLWWAFVFFNKIISRQW